MLDRLDPEFRVGLDTSSAVSGETQDPLATDEIVAEVSAETRALIARCMDGTEPLGQPIPPNWPKKLTSQAIQATMLRAAGLRAEEIAEMVGMTKSYIWLLLAHPYTKRIIRSILADRGTTVIDIRTKLERYANDSLDKIWGLMVQCDDIDKVSRVGFGILDRAGYNPVAKVEGKFHSETHSFNEPTLRRLASAMEESNAVDSHVMPTYIPKPPPDEGRVDSGDSQETADTPGSSDPAHVHVQVDAGPSGVLRRLA